MHPNEGRTRERERDTKAHISGYPNEGRTHERERETLKPSLARTLMRGRHVKGKGAIKVCEGEH